MQCEWQIQMHLLILGTTSYVIESCDMQANPSVMDVAKNLFLIQLSVHALVLSQQRKGSGWGFSEAACLEDGFQGGELTAGNALCCLHHSSKRLVVHSGAAAVPGGHGAIQGTLNDASVVGRDCRGAQSKSLQSLQEIHSSVFCP